MNRNPKTERRTLLERFLKQLDAWHDTGKRMHGDLEQIRRGVAHLAGADHAMVQEAWPTAAADATTRRETRASQALIGDEPDNWQRWKASFRTVVPLSRLSPVGSTLSAAGAAASPRLRIGQERVPEEFQGLF